MPSELEYEELRALVRSRVQLDRRTAGLRLAGIDQDAVSQTDTWFIPPRKVDWDWERLVRQKRGAALDLSIWHEDMLCGLAFGSAQAAWLELGYVETRPYDHPLGKQIMAIALAVLELNAVVLEISETRIRNPFPDLRWRYIRHGYNELVKDGYTTYLCKRRGTREQ
ncbi:hypothetical protein [Methylobacterium sp.]|uniref:hypothetical protein n=1 Tax=Methylobacterium sp. TaxID=409 RepID=UPI0025EED4B9|nr:hypothetical protein [Methylobacterium sp.]MBY0260138.1 hypothetical protein [Methylobacterium sp.]